MPNFTEETELAEVNLRFRDGKLVSRECWDRVVIKRDGEAIKQEGVRAEVTDEQLADILGATVAGLTSQVIALTEKYANALDQALALVAEKRELEAAVAAHETTIAAKDAEIAARDDAIAQLREPE